MNEINRTTHRITRRTFIKHCGKIYFGLVTTSIMGAYSYKIERFWYEVKHIHLKVKRLPESFNGWRIVQFSDIHFGFFYGINDFKPVVKMINSLNPDIIFFTGDLIEAGNMKPERYWSLLQELRALRGGKWAVIGNHDMSIKDRVARVLQHSEFTVLDNSHRFVESGQHRLYIAGIDDVMYGLPNIQKAVEGISEEACVFLLVHEPDIADESSKYSIGAQFSGHSHGGQIRFPFFGPLIKQGLANNYNDGLYHVGESKMPLYVNRGIGTTHLPFRWFCRPEITVFHLSS
ncbi:metallophosphoesterase [Neobacillus muris]|uniref:metallophosphoesterase n=1 Tax=Neobacillus muris TaxID=2941334 RepID=UPI002042160C|nr:metallophosphoesterase [Neobacillus muris]